MCLTYPFNAAVASRRQIAATAHGEPPLAQPPPAGPALGHQRRRHQWAPAGRRLSHGGSNEGQLQPFLVFTSDSAMA